jgi:galactose-1-phosphate uridylyltransferase
MVVFWNGFSQKRVGVQTMGGVVTHNNMAFCRRKRQTGYEIRIIAHDFPGTQFMSLVID